MAEGSFRLYQSAQEKANFSDIASASLAMALVKSAYTPASSHSLWSQVSGNEASYSATHILSSVDWTVSGTATKLTCANENFTAAAGEITAQYAVVYSQPTGQLICIAELSTADVVANQINLTLGTLFKCKDSSGMYS